MEHLDFGVSLAFWLCILSTVLCVVYGAMNWNKEDKENLRDIQKMGKR